MVQDVLQEHHRLHGSRHCMQQDDNQKKKPLHLSDIKRHATKL